MSKTKKKKRVRPPMSTTAMVAMGVRLAASRHIHQKSLDEVSTTAMKRMIGQLEASIAEIKETETVLTNYGLNFFPELKWPRTVAYWRKDLCRTC